MGCCDCGLVHRMEFDVQRINKLGHVQVIFRAWRDEKETKYLRKKNKIRVKQVYK